MIYQPHIDGLRAVAVLSVILFHLDLKEFQGGYVGVDVFFVISGFLITSIISKELQQTGRFRFANFYVRRARRLLPALFAVLSVCSVVALFLYSSQRLYEYGVALIYSVFSAANFLFWLESGYFDTGADSKLLLHMWSLSVEEQFYLFWPLGLCLTYKFLSPKLIFVLGVAGFLLSLLANIILTNVEVDILVNQSEMMFYLMPFRVYEFLIGAFGVWLFNKVSSNHFLQEFLFLLGAGFIFWAMTQFTPSLAFPYYVALLPCVGTLCIILAKGSVLCKVLLENRVMVFIGLISYTLYLVHWPTIVFFKYFRLTELSFYDVVIVLLITAIVTLLIHYIVEKPLRRPNANTLVDSRRYFKNSPNRNFLFSCLGASLVLATVGSVFASTSGLYAHKHELISQEALQAGKSKRYDLIRKGCHFADLDSSKCDRGRALQVLIIGNSHEPDGYNIFHNMFGNDPSVNIIRFGGTNYCDVIEKDSGELFSPIKKRDCSARVEKLNDLDFIQSIDVVVYSSNRPFMPNKLSTWKILRHISLHNSSVKLLVLGTYFNTERYCAEIANRFNDISQCINLDYVSYIGNNELEKIYNIEVVNASNFVYLDKFAALCTNNELESCPTSANGEPMFYDQHHLSMGFAEFIGSRFLQVYKTELEEAGFSVDSTPK